MGTDSLGLQLFKDFVLTPSDTSALIMPLAPSGGYDGLATMLWVTVAIIFVVGVATGYFIRVAVD